MKPYSLPTMALALTAAFFASAAKADTFNFSFGTAQDSHSGAGTITGNDIGNGEFLITSITGTTDGSAITGLADPRTLGGNDNVLLFPADSHGAFFDNGGVSFDVDLGGGQQAVVNLFEGNDFLSRVLFSVGGDAGEDTLEPITVTRVPAPSPVPEPSSIGLFGTGAVGLASMVRRRFAR